MAPAGASSRVGVEVPGVPLSAKATVDAVTTDVTETRPLEPRDIMSFVSYKPA
ncbi:hypothetical protein GCM10022206_03750 [Streptomyces chiangmaiensis]